MITDVTCPQFSTAILQRARLKSEGMKLALGKNQSLGFWPNRRPHGSHTPADLSANRLEVRALLLRDGVRGREADFWGVRRLHFNN